MSSSLKKVNPGDPLVIPAGAYNTFVDVARDYLDRRQDQGQEAHPAARHSGIVLVRNDAGEDVTSRFAVLGIDGPDITPPAPAGGLLHPVAGGRRMAFRLVVAEWPSRPGVRPRAGMADFDGTQGIGPVAARMAARCSYPSAPIIEWFARPG